MIETTVTPFAYEVRVDETVRGVLPGHPQPDDRRRSFPAGDARLDTDGASDGHLRDDHDDELHRPVRLRLEAFATDTSTGLFAQDDISVTSFSPAGISIYGYYGLGSSGVFVSSNVTNNMFPR